MSWQKRFAAGVCTIAMLAMGGCGPKNDIPNESTPEYDVRFAEFEPSTLEREIPVGYAGDGTVFDLKKDNYSSNTSVELTPVTLHCSDGVDRPA